MRPAHAVGRQVLEGIDVGIQAVLASSVMSGAFVDVTAL